MNQWPNRSWFARHAIQEGLGESQSNGTRRDCTVLAAIQTILHAGDIVYEDVGKSDNDDGYPKKGRDLWREWVEQLRDIVKTEQETKGQSVLRGPATDALAKMIALNLELVTDRDPADEHGILGRLWNIILYPLRYLDLV